MEKNHPIAHFVHGFFHHYLGAQRGLSTNTIANYRDSLKLLFQFASQQCNKPVDKLAVEHLNVGLVLAFLNHLEAIRDNCPRTRNNRLAALRAFFHHVAREEPLLWSNASASVQSP